MSNSLTRISLQAHASGGSLTRCKVRILRFESRERITHYNDPTLRDGRGRASETESASIVTSRASAHHTDSGRDAPPHAELGTLRGAIAAVFLLCVAIALPSTVWAQRDPPPVNFTIAFIGDQGLGPNAEAVLNLIKNEGANAVLHQGDFDCVDNPAGWDGQINRILGPDFPYFASVGNHDSARFYGPGGYQEFLAARMNRVGIPWDGDLGVRSSFHYNGFFILLTAPGTLGTGHDTYIRDQLASDDSIWRISSWHKNMRLMQVENKTDDTGWGVYGESRKGGTIVATGHDHSYTRTHLLSSFQNQTVASTSNTLILASDNLSTHSDEGRSFAFVSGLGGNGIYSQTRSL